MAKINYNGIELEEFTSDKPVFFDPPIKMYVTDDSDFKRVSVESVIAYIPSRANLKAVGIHNSWRYCFSSKPRRATWLELAKWCLNGNGLVLDTLIEKIDTGVMFKVDHQNNPVDDKIKVRKWDDTEWHMPDVEYMSIEEASTREIVLDKTKCTIGGVEYFKRGATHE